MADIQAHIANFASKNEELLNILRQTDYAEATLKQQQVYVKDLENELTQLTTRIRQLEEKTRIEKSEFENYRDSNIKRFAHKLGGSKGREKFQSRTEKEEREYYEALEQERAAKDRKESLSAALQEGISARENYQRDNEAHIRAQKELDDLYNMVFAGPTPAYPHEDQSEWQFTQSRSRFNDVEQKYRAIWQACDIFHEALKHITLSAQYMEEARSASQMDMFGGGMMADMAERSALGRAESEASQVQSLVTQASRVFPEGVQNLPRIEIASGSMMSDMMFDNIFTDYSFHGKIKNSLQQVLQAKQHIEAQFNVLNQRLATQKQELDTAQVDLTNTRRALQDLRTQIFTQASGQAPPPYQ